MRKHRCPGGVKVARFPGMSEVSAGLVRLRLGMSKAEVSGSIPVSRLCSLLIFVVFTLCLPCYSALLSACTVSRGAPSTPRCKGSTLSRHVRNLGIDSRVRTLFSIDLCCIYLVFTMLFIFVKRMYN